MIRSYAAVAFLFAVMPSFIMASGGVAPPEAAQTLELHDVPLLRALDAIAVMEGREIVVMGDIQGQRVSVSLRRGHLERSLRNALHDTSYALVWGVDDTITLWIAEAGDENDGQAATEYVIQPPSASGTPVLPADEEGKSGYTNADIDHYRSRQEPLDPASMEVFPPEEKDGNAVYHLKVQQVKARQAPPGPEVQVVPPDTGVKGMTLGEVESLRKQRKALPDTAHYGAVVPRD